MRATSILLTGAGRCAAGLLRVCALLLIPGSSAGQLPPEIELDRFLLQAEQAVEDDDDGAAWIAMGKILALQEEHGLEPVPEDHFRYAKVWDRVEDHQRALESLGRYLELRGRDADHYLEALELVNHAEGVLEAEQREERRFRIAERARGAEARDRAEAERDTLGPPPVGPAGMEFVWVPAGEFRMGSTELRVGPMSVADFYGETPVTQVRISRGFWLGKYEVTQDEWAAVMGSNPSTFSGCGRCPVEEVSWDDVQGFIQRLNRQAGRAVYRLPTEAEWEYAAHAGTTGDRYGNLDAIAWYESNSGFHSHPVGQKAPNAWGLHDTIGNVWEWVEDWYGAYPGGAVTDPRGPGSGSGRVSRGGGWHHDEIGVRAFARFRREPGYRFDSLGFRLPRTQ